LVSSTTLSLSIAAHTLPCRTISTPPPPAASGTLARAPVLVSTLRSAPPLSPLHPVSTHTNGPPPAASAGAHVFGSSVVIFLPEEPPGPCCHTSTRSSTPSSR